MKLLPDGTVEIRNKKTGATKVVKPNDLPSYGIPYTAYEGELKSAKNVGIQTTAQLMPEEDKAATAVEKDKQKKAQIALEALGRVEQSLGQDPNLLLKKSLPFAPGARAFEGDVSSLTDILGNLRTGATITPEQQKLYQNILPKLGDSPETIAKKIEAVRTELGQYAPQEQAGMAPTPEMSGSIVGQPQEGLAMQTARQRAPQPKGGLDMLTDFLFGNIKQAPGRINQLSQEQAARPKAKGIGEVVGRSAKDTMSLLGIAAPAGVEAGLSLGGMLGIGKGAQATGKVASKVAGKAVSPVTNKLSLKAIGKERDAAIEAAKKVTVNGDDLVKPLLKYVENDPLAKNVANKIIPSIKGKTIDLPTLMEKIDVWNDAYTQAGRVGKSAEAGANNVLARAAKEILKDKAPQVSKANQKFSGAYKGRRILSRSIPYVAGGIGLSAGGDILKEMLFGRD
jgi:hypothetical protein